MGLQACADSEPAPIPAREYGHPRLEWPLDHASLARADQHVFRGESSAAGRLPVRSARQAYGSMVTTVYRDGDLSHFRAIVAAPKLLDSPM